MDFGSFELKVFKIIVIIMCLIGNALEEWHVYSNLRINNHFEYPIKTRQPFCIGSFELVLMVE